MGNSVLPKILYNSFDLLNNGQVRKYYHLVREKNAGNAPFEPVEIKGFLQKWGFDPVLENNPVMDKDDIKSYTQKVNQADIHRWAYTGGSYGEPLRVPYSKRRGLIRTATFKYFNEAAGYHLGDPFFLIRAKNKSSFMKYLRNENIFIPGDISEPRIREFVHELRDKKIKVLMGYPTVMYEVALFLQQNPSEKRGLSIKSLISVSEPLEDFKRRVIHDVFGCVFVDRFSNEEVGLIAQQKEFGGDHYVNKFGVYVEVIDPETLKPVKEGEQGKVVVTDLCNELIPVIRYDTGDLATAVSYREGQLETISNIVGRVSEQIFSVAGNPVSSLMLGPYIYKPLSKQGPVYQYQFAQTSAGRYELRIKTGKDDISGDVIDEVVKGLKDVLGNEAVITVVFCENIKPQPSGKRPIYKNEMEVHT